VTAPIIIGTPPPTDPWSEIVSQGDKTAIAGPYLGSNGHFYQIIIVFDNASGHSDIGVAKSTDGGVTYSILVASGATTIAANNVSVTYRGSGDVIDCLITISTGPSAYKLSTVTFNMSTEAFGSPNDTGLTHNATTGSPIDWLIAVNGSGEQVVAYDIQNAGATAASVYAIRYHSGSWSPAILASGATTLAYLDQVLTDGSGNVHILWSDWQAGGPDAGVLRNAIYDSILTAGAITSTNTAMASANAVNDRGYGDHDFKPGIYDASTDSVAWPVVKQVLSGATTLQNSFGVLIGTPSSAPVFSYVNAYSTPNPVSYVSGWPSLSGKSDGTEFSLVWAVDGRSNDHLPNGLTLQRSTASTLAGTWSAPTTFYDPSVNPPVETIAWIASELFFNWCRYVGSSQSFAANVDMVVSGGSSFNPFAFPPTVTASTLQLIKQVAGGPASPTDFIVAATGDTDSITGAGTAGPSPVIPGTYQLSESGPANYTGVWNCGPAVMPTPTSVVVPASVSASAPIQVGTAEYRPPTSGVGKYYFEIGANLYQVLVSAQGGSPQGLIGVFKRATSNIGGSWALMNATASPDQGNQSGYYKCTIDPTGTVIQIAYLTVGQLNLKIASYNTVTDTWGTPTAALTVPLALSTFAFVQRPDFTFVLVAGASGTLFPLYYALNTSGAWGPLTLLASSNHIVLDGFLDASGTIYILFNSPTFGCACQRISPILPAYLLVFPLTPVANAISLTPGGYPSIIQWGSSSFAIGFIDTAGPTPGAAQVFIGPLTGPVLPGNLVVQAPSGSEVLSYVRPVQGSDGKLNVFYADTDYTVPKIQIHQSVYGGSTWGAPTTFYDAITNPPTNPATPASAQAINAISAIQLSPQGWTAATALNTVTPTYSTGEFLEMGSAGSTAVVCTIVNTYSGPVVPIPSPCANVVPQPSTDTQFELRRVYATMKPAPRLPIRGGSS